MTIAIWQAIVAMLLGGIGFAISVNPLKPKHKKRKWWFATAFILLSTCMIWLVVKQGRENKEKETNAKKAFDTAQENQDRRFDTLQSNQWLFMQNQQNLLVELATNGVGVDFPKRMLELDKQMNNLNQQDGNYQSFIANARGDLQHKRASRMVEQAERNLNAELDYMKVVPVYDCLVVTLTNMLALQAKHNQDEVVSTYHSMPLFPKGVRNWRTNFAEIHFKSNTNWHFSISAGSDSGDPFIEIMAEGAFVHIMNQQLMFDLTGTTQYGFRWDGNYRKLFQDELKAYVAAAEEQTLKKSR